MEEDDKMQFDTEISSPLLDEKQSCWKKHLTTIIFLICSVIIITVVVIIIVLVKKDDKQDEKPFTILKYDKDFLKPEIRLNAEFQLVKTKNGMTGLLINDPYSKISHVMFQVQNGYLMDTVAGLAHFDEHMIFGGSEKYVNYSYERMVGGMDGYDGSAYTSSTYQAYYTTIKYNFKYDKAIDILIDSFRYPLYSESVIEKEIQPVNSEFYAGINEQYFLMENIIRQLSPEITSFHNMGCGNNDTLKPSEAAILSKKLKGYHMVVNRPEKISFVLFSNETINDLQKYVETYFTYKMHEFSDKEIDIEDKKKLENNIENLKKKEVFDSNLYLHGIYYNSSRKQNILEIFFHIGKVDYKDIGFHIMDYFSYLFNSKSLLSILKNKNYISLMNKIEFFEYVKLENNNIYNLIFTLTQNGIDNINEVLLIVYKYIDIIKKEGYKKKYFENFIKYRQSNIINNFNKDNIYKYIPDISDEIIYNYITFGEKQILTNGAPNINHYDENLLKQYLNQIQSEKSFFVVNSISKATEIKTFLKSAKIEKLNYYNINFLYGEYPDDFKNQITDNNKTYDGLSMREINDYFSEKYEKVIPCYKQETNKCKELNEFDYEKENEYKGTLLEENEYFITYYQIDKSSESFIVNSYLEIFFEEYADLEDETINLIEQLYIDNILSEINELDTISIEYFDSSIISFRIKSFTDNTETIIKNFIDYMNKEPNETDFVYTINSIKSYFILNSAFSFKDYVFNLGEQFLNKGEETIPKTEQLIENIDKITFDDFKNIHSQIFEKIHSITFKIAGNIDKELVESIHNYFKENIKTKPQYLNTFKRSELVSNVSFIYNYYQKSTMTSEVDNGILVIYQIDEQYEEYMDILKGCFDNIAMINLRLNYSNAYHPRIYIENNLLYIFEQGKYKEIPQMEDDINEVLLGMLNGNVKCENYADIVKSYKLKGNEKIEKTPENLFSKFIEGENLNKNKLKETIFPDTFLKFMDEISDIFIYPKRYTISVVRNGISDDDFAQMFENRKNNAKYIINNEINIEHTLNISFLKDKILS